MATEKSARKGGRQRRGNTALDLPPDLYELYNPDREESYNHRKTRIQWIRRYWAEQWFKYNFVTPEYAEKNAIKRPWGDILYKNLQPNTKHEAIAQGFYPCMVRGPQPENANPSFLRWCCDDDLFKRNFQFAKEFSAKNKKEFRLNFNPNLSARWSDGTREVNENRIGPINNFDGLLSHDADSKDAPTPPKQKKKSKA